MANNHRLILLILLAYSRVTSVAVARIVFVMEHNCPHRFSRQFGFHQDIPADIGFSILPSSKIMLRLHQVCIRYGTNSRVQSPSQCLSLERKFTLRFEEWWSKVFLTSSGTYPVGHSKRKRDSSSDQNIQRDEGPSDLKPKLKIFRSHKHLRSPVLETEDNTPQTKIPGVGAAISIAPIPAIPIPSVAMLAKAPDEVRLTPETSPAIACRQKLKSIVVCTPDEQGTSNVQGNGVENIMDILDCNPSPTKCMGDNSYINFKEKLAFVPLPSEVTISPQLSIYHPLCRISLAMIYVPMIRRVFVPPNDDDKAKSTPKADAP
ncbi:hypothetical protein Cgig2_019214 [Carnegiea gigantea]|uniref:Uncharacterized protein n=1 Tax=Carnegiea gigantea TaxID=171969 RepID=A0A9Q1JK04_9CARY|nr:hypothetical protein Cgig2_019214 [Carnegiea gigantea]